MAAERNAPRDLPHRRVEGALDIRERLRAFGRSALRDEELIALVLRTGDRRNDALQIARRTLVACGSARALAERACDELESINGIGPARAASLVAAIELGRRAQRPSLDVGAPLDSPMRAAEHVRQLTTLRKREEFHVLMLDAKHCVLGHRVVSVGTLQSSLVHPREVFRSAIRVCAAAILVAHNHPSGDPTPSEDDHGVTQRLEEAGVWLGIPLVDHLVLGDRAFFSFAEQRLFPWE